MNRTEKKELLECNPPPIQYCGVCGRELKVSIKEIRLGSKFDTESGRRSSKHIYARYHCPSIWRLFHNSPAYFLSFGGWEFSKWLSR